MLLRIEPMRKLGAWMSERSDLLEATMDCHPEGVALMGKQCNVVLWNPAAEAITGFLAQDLLGRAAPEELKPLLSWSGELMGSESCPEQAPGCLFHTRHKLGHALSVFSRLLVLRDEMGSRVGTAFIFHPAESLDALPQGERTEGARAGESHADFEDRLSVLFDDFLHGGLTFGVLWITVDQAHELRKTHGAGACESMLEKVGRALTHGLRPGEEMVRWGDDEFLVLSHERTAEMLAAHAKMLAGLARTADFRWWGDKTELTVSIGAAQADMDGTLVALLERAKAAMLTSFHADGNRITLAPEEHSCSPS
jgi:diguanylate cyclase (GGDEF)-like protein/PAS domain S-box-containing protein